MKGIVDLAEQLEPTKRSILKISAMFYDPLGLIAPIVLPSKLIFHKISVAKYDWDTEVSHKYVLLWNKFIKGLKMLEGVSFVGHHVLCACENRKIELHGFCDSSGEAYSACMYIY